MAQKAEDMKNGKITPEELEAEFEEHGLNSYEQKLLLDEDLHVQMEQDNDFGLGNAPMSPGRIIEE